MNQEVKVHSVPEYIEYIQSAGVRFYRGQSQDWELMPSLGRVNTFFDEPVYITEKVVLQEFKKLSAPYLDLTKAPDSEIVLHAQHYGLPTRLLDFSTSPLTALWFAVCDVDNTNDGVVWGIESHWVYYTEENIQMDTEELYFHIPTHLNERIQAQHSAFLVFPVEQSDDAALRSIQSEQYNLEKITKLTKIIIPSSIKHEILSNLCQLGITAKTIYPGISGIVDHLKYFLFDRQNALTQKSKA